MAKNGLIDLLAKEGREIERRERQAKKKSGSALYRSKDFKSLGHKAHETPVKTGTEVTKEYRMNEKKNVAREGTPARGQIKAPRRAVALPTSCEYTFTAGEQVMCEMSPGKFELVSFQETSGKFHYVAQGKKEFRVWLNKLLPVAVYNVIQEQKRITDEARKQAKAAKKQTVAA